MTARISHTSVDSRDAYARSVFWGRVLGFTEDPDDPNEPGHEECMIFSPDRTQRLLFIEVPDDSCHGHVTGPQLGLCPDSLP
jgi:hypothetical protein